MEGSIFLFPNH